MASLDEQVKNLNEQRLRAWERGKEILDRALAEGRTLNQEETNNYNQINDDISRIDNTRDALVSSERAAKEYHQVNDELARVSTPIERETRTTAAVDEAAFFRRTGPGSIDIDLKPAIDAHNAVMRGYSGQELRAVLTDGGSSGGSLTVPTQVAQSVYAYMTASVAMRRIGCTILSTDSGAPMTIPKVGTHGIATQVASQDTAFAGTDAVLAALTLNAYDYGQLVAVSADMIADSGVDVVDFVARNIGRAIGQITATAYVTGGGSSAPQGIQGAITSGSGAGTVSSGGSLFGLPAGRELEKLIDVQYTVADSYRQNGAAWLMRDLTGASVRKIRDGAGGTAGQFVWQPSPTVGAIGGQPDTFLGDPVFFDPNVASMASNAKIVFYGDFSSYYIRDVRNFSLERSDHFLFSKNQVAFRGLLRTDGDLLDNYALTCLTQNV